MQIHVTSEIGVLKRVMLHRPGKELEQLVPKELERLLFDDIPYLKTACLEHDRFAEILRQQGAEVVYLEELMEETLEQSQDIRKRFIHEFIREGGSMALLYEELLFAFLDSMESTAELVQKTMAGVRLDELDIKRPGSFHQLAGYEHGFVLDPIPNLYFTRDPFAAIGNGASVNGMYSGTRRRETIYGDYILKYHPQFQGKVRFYYSREYPFSIEGGDILNLSRRVLAVGISQRTTPAAIELLAENLFADPEASIEMILALDIPNIRAFMHLDTVLTQVDYDKFIIHPEILNNLRIYEICRGDREERLHISELSESLPVVLGTRLGLDQVTLIRCGGKDRIASEREQWNDGSNTLCIAPGRVIVYDRNYITNEILRQHGIQVLEMPSSELSRGRGGPRCMSMPLWREEP